MIPQRPEADVLQRQLDFRLDPVAIHWILFRPCPVEILVVTDSSGSFGNADFGLSELLDVLSVSPGPWVRFNITKAHRQNDPSADVAGFRFDAHDLSDYHQIWLVGVDRTFDPLDDSELRAISEFMDNGGGVFATGDHEDLGRAMCAEVPRVRSMRKWYWPSPGPNGEPVAPPVSGVDRHDTLRVGGDPGFQFDDQSDDVPQQISPRLYGGWVWPWMRAFYPHPLLCGPQGVLRFLPDHMHEGECYVPSDLTMTFTFDGYTIEEYPQLSGGARLAPEVIADATVIGRSAGTPFPGPVNAGSFGVIGAYDGHRTGVGRVVVDATWHHIFNINLVGELGNPDPVKGQGFYASAAGLAAYEDIKTYFRNVAVWLAPPAVQVCMRWRALWWCRWNHRILIEFRPQVLEEGVRQIRLPELLRIGVAARDVLGRYASQCQTTLWVRDLVAVLSPDIYRRLEPWLDPWLPPPPEPPGPDPTPWAVGDIFTTAVLGAALYAIAERSPLPNEEVKEKLADLSDDHWLELLSDATEAAVTGIVEMLRESGRLRDQLVDAFSEAEIRGKQ